jgi:carbamoyl-phosphate synthase large subunit
MTQRQRLLHVLGGGQWQVPTIRRARAMGYRVLVTDIYADRPGYAFADHHEVMDITNLEGTLSVAQRYGIDGSICDTTDVGVPTAAYVAEKMGLPGIGYETALRFTDKYRMRRLVAEAGLQDTRFLETNSADQLDAAAEYLGFPLVVKPVDSQSSRGVHIVRQAEQLRPCFEDALSYSKRRSVLLEEFLPGTEATVEGLCVRGRYYTLAVSDKSRYTHRPEVARRLTYPAAFAPHVLERLMALNEAVVHTLGLKNGVTHAEYMVNGDDVRLVEIAARGGGSRVYSHIAPHVSGIDVLGAYLRFVMGEEPEQPETPRGRAANLEFLDLPGGRVRAIHGLDETRRLPGIAEVLLEFGVGDTLRPPEDDRARPGFLLVFGDTRAQVLERTERALRTLRMEVA